MSATSPLPPPSLPQPPHDRAESLLALFSTHSQGDYIGESISQLEHSLQCAHLALQAGSSQSTIAAALLHDIGQFVPFKLVRETIADVDDGDEQETDVGRPNHATLGARYLSALGFPNHTCNIVAQHVAAKRYLTSVDPGYLAQLSDASKASLREQGGPMSAEERRHFEKLEGWKQCLEVRRWDDMAKVVGIVDRTPRLQCYLETVWDVLRDAALEV